MIAYCLNSTNKKTINTRARLFIDRKIYYIYFICSMCLLNQSLLFVNALLLPMFQFLIRKNISHNLIIPILYLPFVCLPFIVTRWTIRIIFHTDMYYVRVCLKIKKLYFFLFCFFIFYQQIWSYSIHYYKRIS